MKRRILCFGDSNTYGYDPRGGRYDENTRWPMRMEKLLGRDYTVIEEGFNGRTCVMDDPTEGGYKSGANYLPPCLMSHNPLDAVVIMLGSNDSKKRFGLEPMTIGEGMMQLIRLTRLYSLASDGGSAKIVIVAPPPIRDCLEKTRYRDCFGPDAIRITKDLSAEYARIARLLRCEFVDAAMFAQLSEMDSLHFTREDHLRMAEGMANKLRAMFENDNQEGKTL